MKVKFLILLLLIIASVGCEDAVLQPSPYPLIYASVVAVDKEEAVVLAEILRPGTEPVVEYGFLWSLSTPVTLASGNSEVIQGDLPKDAFQVVLNSNIHRITTYYARPFAKTDDLTIYGNEISFKTK